MSFGLQIVAKHQDSLLKLTSGLTALWSEITLPDFIPLKLLRLALESGTWSLLKGVLGVYFLLFGEVVKQII